MIYPVTQSWAIMNFIRIFDSLIFDYRNEKYSDQRSLKKANAKIFKEIQEKEAEQKFIQKQSSMKVNIKQKKQADMLRRATTTMNFK